MKKIIKKYATGDEVPMTIEELLEALPCELSSQGDVYALHIIKSNGSWFVFYEAGYNIGDDLYEHKGTLREALEGVYNDLVSNKLI